MNPGMPERCDPLDVDEDCDGVADDDDLSVPQTLLLYKDADGDGFGDPEHELVACDPTSGFTVRDGDCDDDEPRIPAAREVCMDGGDNDCDGRTDVCHPIPFPPGDRAFEAFNTDAQLGRALSLQGDATGDGVADLLVSAITLDGWAEVLVFAGPLAGALDPEQPTARLTSDLFEWGATAIVVGHDLDGDGRGDVLFGGQDGSGFGAVVLVSGPVAGQVYTGSSTAISTSGAYDSAGWAVAAGRFDADGPSDLAVAAPKANNGEGAV